MEGVPAGRSRFGGTTRPVPPLELGRAATSTDPASGARSSTRCRTVRSMAVAKVEGCFFCPNEWFSHPGRSSAARERAAGVPRVQPVEQVAGGRVVVGCHPCARVGEQTGPGPRRHRDHSHDASARDRRPEPAQMPHTLSTLAAGRSRGRCRGPAAGGGARRRRAACAPGAPGGAVAASGVPAGRGPGGRLPARHRAARHAADPGACWPRPAAAAQQGGQPAAGRRSAGRACSGRGSGSPSGGRWAHRPDAAASSTGWCSVRASWVPASVAGCASSPICCSG